MNLRSLGPERLTLLAVLGAWLGIWGAWIAHAAVGLTQNAFYLAEWSTYLLDVRYGGMRLAPELVRLAAALASLAGCVALGSVNDWRLRWVLRLLAVPIGLNLLPPYPDILNLWWSEGYGVRFVISALFWVGFAGCFLVDRLNPRVKSIILIVLAVGAGIGGLLSFLQLRGPFSAHYAMTILPGWGLALFSLGLAVAVGLQAWGLIQTIRENQKGPDAI